MEYKNLDFDGNCLAQYSSLRDEMSKICVTFWPYFSYPCKFFTLSKKEKEAFTKKNKAESELIKRGYARIREKVKEIRQSFSQAVVNRKRSGSGKIVFEFYDELIRMWGGSAAIQPLSFGVDTETLNDLNSSQNTQLQQSLLSNDDEILGVDGTVQMLNNLVPKNLNHWMVVKEKVSIQFLN